METRHVSSSQGKQTTYCKKSIVVHLTCSLGPYDYAKGPVKIDVNLDPLSAGEHSTGNGGMSNRKSPPVQRQPFLGKDDRDHEGNGGQARAIRRVLLLVNPYSGTFFVCLFVSTVACTSCATCRMSTAAVRMKALLLVNIFVSLYFDQP